MSRENNAKNVKKKIIGCFCFAVVAAGAVLAPAAIFSPNTGLAAAADDNTTGSGSVSNVKEIKLNDLLTYAVPKLTTSNYNCDYNGIKVEQAKYTNWDGSNGYLNIYIITLESGNYKFTGSNLYNNSYVDVKFNIPSGSNVSIDFADVTIVNTEGYYIISGAPGPQYYCKIPLDTSNPDNNCAAVNYTVPFNVEGELTVTGTLSIDTNVFEGECYYDRQKNHRYIVPLKEGNGIFSDKFDKITFIDSISGSTSKDTVYSAANGMKAISYPCKKKETGSVHNKVYNVYTNIERVTAKQSHTDANNDGKCDDCGKSLSSSGGSSSKPSRPSRPVTPPEPKPIINGKEISWSKVAKEIMSLEEGSEYRIELNGITDIPEEVIKAIADKKIKTTFVVGIARSFYADGAYISAPCAADLTMDYSNDVNTDGLRGIVGTRFSIHNTNIPTDIDIIFKEEHAGKFANLYKEYDDGTPKHLFTTEISDSGKVKYEGIKDAGDYVVMINEFSDLPGDMDNDGILNAKDALAILKDSVGIEKGINPYVADINNDGFINAMDAIEILKRSVGLT